MRQHLLFLMDISVQEELLMRISFTVDEGLEGNFINGFFK